MKQLLTKRTPPKTPMKPMTQSDRAKMQPRDDKGRFAEERSGIKDPKKSGAVALYRGREPTRSDYSSRGLSENAADLILIDESNMFSNKGEKKYLIVVSTRVPGNVRAQYGSIVRNIPMKKGVRAKYSNTSVRDTVPIVKEISEKDVDIVESHAKITNDVWTRDGEKEKLYVKVLSKSLEKALNLDSEKEVDVVIDSVPFKVDDKLEELGKDLFLSGKPIRWFETRRSASDRGLQVHDYETGAVAGWIEGDEKGTTLFEKYLRRRFRGVP